MSPSTVMCPKFKIIIVIGWLVHLQPSLGRGEIKKTGVSIKLIEWIIYLENKITSKYMLLQVSSKLCIKTYLCIVKMFSILNQVTSIKKEQMMLCTIIKKKSRC